MENAEKEKQHVQVPVIKAGLVVIATHLQLKL
jgi:hypothetical protein